MTPTGRPLVFTGANVDRVVDGKIVEHGAAAKMLVPLLGAGAIRVVSDRAPPCAPESASEGIPRIHGPMNREVGILLRLEGLVVLALAVTLYARLEASWWLFALLFLVPDVSMVGYLKNEKLGATVYNAVHTYVGPALLGSVMYGVEHGLLGQIAVIWVSHIALDRMLGFGLKHPSGFGDTHLKTLKKGS